MLFKSLFFIFFFSEDPLIVNPSIKRLIRITNRKCMNILYGSMQNLSRDNEVESNNVSSYQLLLLTFCIVSCIFNLDNALMYNLLCWDKKGTVAYKEI